MSFDSLFRVSTNHLFKMYFCFSLFIDCITSELFKTLTVSNRCTVDADEINAVLIEYWEILSQYIMKMIHENVRNAVFKLQITRKVKSSPWLAQTSGTIKFCDFGFCLSSL